MLTIVDFVNNKRKNERKAKVKTGRVVQDSEDIFTLFGDFSEN